MQMGNGKENAHAANVGGRPESPTSIIPHTDRATVERDRKRAPLEGVEL